MTSKYFIMESRTLNRRLLTELQHKLRVVLKCYTITEFKLNENNRTFTFKKSYRIKGVRMNDPKEYNGFYEIENVENNKCKLQITIT